MPTENKICKTCEANECGADEVFAGKKCDCKCHQLGLPPEKLANIQNPSCVVTSKWEKEFFSKLAEKLEELFPKTNQDHPEVPSEGNRTTALVLNAFANIIFKDILEKALSRQKSEMIEEIEKELKHIAMYDNGRFPKYLVKDVLDILDKLNRKYD